MAERIQAGSLEIEKVLYELIKDEVAPGTGVDPDHFFSELEAILRDFMPRNEELLEVCRRCSSRSTSIIARARANLMTMPGIGRF
ncbi:MAG: hypothetical protein U5O39_06155 [Gammaproteobacteria bacterium]|nr:hypothetical protein [Gammaproteobacteria bacterium]